MKMQDQWIIFQLPLYNTNEGHQHCMGCGLSEKKIVTFCVNGNLTQGYS